MLVIVLRHPVILRTQAFVELMVIELPARYNSKVAKAFPYSDQDVYNDVKALIVKFHELAALLFVIISHASDWLWFSDFLCFSLNFFNDALEVAY